jgi:D-beta-D-heptose 7-phosphate kinase/D-beta-D-heptose 1-phosphate adenosyltransferase
MKKKYGITSMYGNPIHPGHIECLKLSKELVDELWVIVNNDNQAELKRGVPSFQDEQYRKTVIESIRYVDRAEIAIDQDGSVCETIKLFHTKITEQNPSAEIIFTKGGDRFANEIPEKYVCDSLGIKIVDGLGLKTHNSSDMVKTKN